jgi:hypothetical protein
MQYIVEAERGHGILLFIQIILAGGKLLINTEGKICRLSGMRMGL